MERWGITVNGYFGSASVRREVAPWWNFAIEDTLWFCVDIFHRTVGRIRIPARICAMKIVREGEEYTFEDWYGTRLGNFDWYVHGPIFQWCHRKRQHILIEIPMADAIRAFGKHAPSFWKESWESGTEQWRDSGPPVSKHGKVHRTADEDPYQAGLDPSKAERAVPPAASAAPK